MELATRLRAARHSAGLTQLQLADQVGCTQGHVAHIEAGRYRPSLALLLATAHALDVPVAALIEEDA